MGKIVNKLKTKKERNEISISFEYFPPRQPKAVEMLFTKVERMVEDLNPEFVDITWGAGGSTSNLTIDIAKQIQYECGVDAQIHMTCTNQKKEDLVKHLQNAKDIGIQNILCLRGDPPKGQEQWQSTEGGLSYAKDLVKLVRELHGDHFGISVAGYPEGHPDGGYEKDLKYLKEKIDCGAEVVVTQLFYDCDKYLNFSKDCLSIGIDAPIVPGIMPIYKLDSFRRMCQLCKVFVPKSIEDEVIKLEEKDKILKAQKKKYDDAEDEAKIKEIAAKIAQFEDDVMFFGVQMTVGMCKYLMSNGVPYFHFYTLNMETSVKSIVEALELLSARKGREIIYSLPFPWLGKGEGVISNRKCEQSRPVYWKHNWSSYIERTQHWNFNSTCSWEKQFNLAISKKCSEEESKDVYFKEPSDCYFFGQYETEDSKRKMWGGEQGHTSIQSIQMVFINFFNQEKKVKRLPWIPRNLLKGKPLIYPKGLGNLVKKGLLVINCQPACCSRPFQQYEKNFFQNDGMLYQRAYIEFFCSKKTFLELKTQLLDTKPAGSWSYHAVNYKGTEQYSNRPKNYFFPVTWVVLSDSPILQPLVVEETTFLKGWKDEAFNLWLTDFGASWGKNSETYDFIKKEIVEKYFLVSLVDNQFISCEKFFNDLFDKFNN